MVLRTKYYIINTLPSNVFVFAMSNISEPFLVSPPFRIKSFVTMAYIYTASWRYREKTEP